MHSPACLMLAPFPFFGGPALGHNPSSANARKNGYTHIYICIYLFISSSTDAPLLIFSYFRYVFR